MTTKEVLIAARAIIDKPQKWRKGAYHENGRYCALGALQEVVFIDEGGNYFTIDKARVQLEHCLPPQPRDSANIVRFNDAPTTTHADIMRVFDCAIAKAK